MKDIFVEVLSNPNLKYPSEIPYNPPKIYPEIKYDYTPSSENKAYEIIRDLFKNLNLDKKNFGTKNWNPLGKFIRKGDTIVIKPNIVKDSKQRSSFLYEAIVTHPSLIRIMVDYAYISTGNRGIINVIDGPIDITDFNSAVKSNGLLDMINFLKSKRIPVNLYDIRSEYLRKLFSFNILGHNLGIYKLTKLKGDPNGYYNFNLKIHSEFAKVEERSDYLRSTQLVRNPKTAAKMHSNGNHYYGICGSMIKSDVIINMPKLKTHKKLGMTLCLKNFVGVTDPRSWLPHYTEKNNNYGDEYAYKHKLKNIIFKFIFKVRKINNLFCVQILKIKKKSNLSFASNVSVKGSNPENDTIWRTCLDINKIILYSDKNGDLRSTPQREILNFVDGIVGGENDGPMSVDPVNSKVVMFSNNPLYTDIIASRMIGVKQNKIIENGLNIQKYKLLEKLPNIKVSYPLLNFKLPPTWRKNDNN